MQIFTFCDTIENIEGAIEYAKDTYLWLSCSVPTIKFFPYEDEYGIYVIKFVIEKNDYDSRIYIIEIEAKLSNIGIGVSGGDAQIAQFGIGLSIGDNPVPYGVGIGSIIYQPYGIGVSTTKATDINGIGVSGKLNENIGIGIKGTYGFSSDGIGISGNGQIYQYGIGIQKHNIFDSGGISIGLNIQTDRGGITVSGYYSNTIYGIGINSKITGKHFDSDGGIGIAGNDSVFGFNIYGIGIGTNHKFDSGGIGLKSDLDYLYGIGVGTQIEFPYGIGVGTQIEFPYGIGITSEIDNQYGIAIKGITENKSGIAVYGFIDNNLGIGIFGKSISDFSGIGIVGYGTGLDQYGVAVKGFTESLYGVGISDSSQLAINGIGVNGLTEYDSYGISICGDGAFSQLGIGITGANSTKNNIENGIAVSNLVSSMFSADGGIGIYGITADIELSNGGIAVSGLFNTETISIGGIAITGNILVRDYVSNGIGVSGLLVTTYFSEGGIAVSGSISKYNNTDYGGIAVGEGTAGYYVESISEFIVFGVSDNSINITSLSTCSIVASGDSSINGEIRLESVGEFTIAGNSIFNYNQAFESIGTVSVYGNSSYYTSIESIGNITICGESECIIYKSKESIGTISVFGESEIQSTKILESIGTISISGISNITDKVVNVSVGEISINGTSVVTNKIINISSGKIAIHGTSDIFENKVISSIGCFSINVNSSITENQSVYSVGEISVCGISYFIFSGYKESVSSFCISGSTESYINRPYISVANIAIIGSSDLFINKVNEKEGTIAIRGYTESYSKQNYTLESIGSISIGGESLVGFKLNTVYESIIYIAFSGDTEIIPEITPFSDTPYNLTWTGGVAPFTLKLFGMVWNSPSNTYTWTENALIENVKLVYDASGIAREAKIEKIDDTKIWCAGVVDTMYNLQIDCGIRISDSSGKHLDVPFCTSFDQTTSDVFGYGNIDRFVGMTASSGESPNITYGFGPRRVVKNIRTPMYLGFEDIEVISTLIPEMECLGSSGWEVGILGGIAPFYIELWSNELNKSYGNSGWTEVTLLTQERKFYQENNYSAFSDSLANETYFYQFNIQPRLYNSKWCASDSLGGHSNIGIKIKDSSPTQQVKFWSFAYMGMTEDAELNPFGIPLFCKLSWSCKTPTSTEMCGTLSNYNFNDMTINWKGGLAPYYVFTMYGGNVANEGYANKIETNNTTYTIHKQSSNDPMCNPQGLMQILVFDSDPNPTYTIDYLIAYNEDLKAEFPAETPGSLLQIGLCEFYSNNVIKPIYGPGISCGNMTFKGGSPTYWEGGVFPFTVTLLEGFVFGSTSEAGFHTHNIDISGATDKVLVIESGSRSIDIVKSGDQDICWCADYAYNGILVEDGAGTAFRAYYKDFHSSERPPECTDIVITTSGNTATWTGGCAPFTIQYWSKSGNEIGYQYTSYTYNASAKPRSLTMNKLGSYWRAYDLLLPDSDVGLKITGAEGKPSTVVFNGTFGPPKKIGGNGNGITVTFEGDNAISWDGGSGTYTAALYGDTGNFHNNTQLVVSGGNTIAQLLPIDAAKTWCSKRYTGVRITDTVTSEIRDVAFTTGFIPPQQCTPTVTWNDPPDMTYGDTFSSLQLNATASCFNKNIEGNNSYGTNGFFYSYTTPPTANIMGAKPNATPIGDDLDLYVEFHPLDSDQFAIVPSGLASTWETVKVNKATPDLIWEVKPPASIVYGTLIAFPTNCKAVTTTGLTIEYYATSLTEFVIYALEDADLTVGAWYIVASIPSSQNYYSKDISTVVNVTSNQAVVTWDAPSPITYGTAISATQLNAQVVGNIPGTFRYSPSSGIVLPVGTHLLTVTFTATDSVTYAEGTASVNVTVTEATLNVTANPISKVYGAVDPTLTYYVTGLVNGDGYTVFTGKLTRASGENVISGGYVIDKGTLSAGKNYNINFTGSVFTITQANQTITSLTLNTTLSGTNQYSAKVGVAVSISALSLTSGINPITFSSDNSTVCVVSEATASTKAQGNCWITANQGASQNYAAATPKSVLLIVQKTAIPSTSITISPTTAVYTGSKITVAASSNPVANLLPVEYFNASMVACDMKDVNTYIVRVTVSDNSYTGSLVTSFSITRALPNIVFNPAPTYTRVPFSAAQLNATTTSGQPILYDHEIGDIISTAGAVSITARIAESANYQENSITKSIFVSDATPFAIYSEIISVPMLGIDTLTKTVTFSGKVVIGGTIQFDIVSITVDGAAFYGWSDNGAETATACLPNQVVTINKLTVNVPSSKTVVITYRVIDQYGNTSSNQTVQLVSIFTKATPTITLKSAVSKVYGYAVSVDDIASWFTVTTEGTFTSTDKDLVVACPGKTINYTFTPTDTDNYNSVSGSFYLTITKSPDFVFDFGTATLVYKVGAEGSFTLSPSNLTNVTFSAPSSQLTITGSTYKIVGVGSCLVKATYAGDSNYSAKTVEHTLSLSRGDVTVTHGNQTVSYTGNSQSTPPVITLGSTTLTGVAISYLFVGTSYNSSTEPTAVGVYTVTATVNTTLYQGSGSWIYTINKTAITSISISPTSAVYTGNVIPITITSVPSATLSAPVYHDSTTAIVPNMKDADTYTIIVDVNDTRYSGSREFTFTVDKAVPQITFNPASGMSKVPFTSAQCNATTTSGQTIHYTHDIGWIPLQTGSSQSITVSAGILESDNYYQNKSDKVITIADATPVVYPNTVQVPMTGVSTKAVNVPFSGRVIAGNKIRYDIVDISDNAVSWADNGVEVIKNCSAGTSDNTSLLSVTIPANGTVTVEYRAYDQYDNISQSAIVSLVSVFTKATPTITLKSAVSKVYGYILDAVDMDSWFTTSTPGEFSSADIDTAISYPGKTVNYTFTPDDLNNYTTTTGSFYLSITKSPDFVFDFSLSTSTYSVGTKGTFSITPVEVTNVTFSAPYNLMSITEKAFEITGVGSCAITATYGGDNNYSIKQITKTITLIKGTVTIVHGNETVVYDGTAKGSSPIIKLGDTVLSNVTPSYLYTGISPTVYNSSSPPYLAGTYSVTATVNTALYQGSGNWALTITKKEITKTSVTITPASATFTGNPISIVASTNPTAIMLPLEYFTSGMSPVTEIKNAGDYIIGVTINDPNYSGDIDIPFTVAKAQPVVSWSPYSAKTGVPFNTDQKNATCALSQAEKSTPTYTFEGISSDYSYPQNGTRSSFFINATVEFSETTNYKSAKATRSISVQDYSPTAIGYSENVSLAGVLQKEVAIRLSGLVRTGTAIKFDLFSIDGEQSFTGDALAETTQSCTPNVAVINSSLKVVCISNTPVTIKYTAIDAYLNVSNQATITLTPSYSALEPVVTYLYPTLVCGTTYTTATAQTWFTAKHPTTGATIAGTISITTSGIVNTAVTSGTKTMNYTFTPTDTNTYVSVSSSVIITVDRILEEERMLTKTNQTREYFAQPGALMSTTLLAMTCAFIGVSIPEIFVNGSPVGSSPLVPGTYSITNYHDSGCFYSPQYTYQLTVTQGNYDDYFRFDAIEDFTLPIPVVVESSHYINFVIGSAQTSQWQFTTSNAAVIFGTRTNYQLQVILNYADTCKVTGTLQSSSPYKASKTISFTLQISKKACVITGANKTVAYNGSAQTITAIATVDGFVRNDLTPTYLHYGNSYIGIGYNSVYPPTNAGTYTVAATVNTNKYYGTASWTLTITRVQAVISSANKTVTYNAQPQSVTGTVTVNGVARTDISVTYRYVSITSGVVFDSITTLPTKVAVYNVYASIDTVNYYGSANWTLSITKPTIVAEMKSNNLPISLVNGVKTLYLLGGKLTSTLNLTCTVTPSALTGTTTWNPVLSTTPLAPTVVTQTVEFRPTDTDYGWDGDEARIYVYEQSTIYTGRTYSGNIANLVTNLSTYQVTMTGIKLICYMSSYNPSTSVTFTVSISGFYLYNAPSSYTVARASGSASVELLLPDSIISAGSTATITYSAKDSLGNNAVTRDYTTNVLSTSTSAIITIKTRYVASFQLSGLQSFVYDGNAKSLAFTLKLNAQIGYPATISCEYTNAITGSKVIGSPIAMGSYYTVPVATISGEVYSGSTTFLYIFVGTKIFKAEITKNGAVISGQVLTISSGMLLSSLGLSYKTTPVIPHTATWHPALNTTLQSGYTSSITVECVPTDTSYMSDGDSVTITAVDSPHIFNVSYDQLPDCVTQKLTISPYIAATAYNTEYVTFTLNYGNMSSQTGLYGSYKIYNPKGTAWATSGFATFQIPQLTSYGTVQLSATVSMGYTGTITVQAVTSNNFTMPSVDITIKAKSAYWSETSHQDCDSSSDYAALYNWATWFIAKATQTKYYIMEEEFHGPECLSNFGWELGSDINEARASGTYSVQNNATLENIWWIIYRRDSWIAA